MKVREFNAREPVEHFWNEELEVGRHDYVCNGRLSEFSRLDGDWTRTWRTCAAESAYRCRRLDRTLLENISFRPGRAPTGNEPHGLNPFLPGWRWRRQKIQSPKETASPLRSLTRQFTGQQGEAKRRLCRFGAIVGTSRATVTGHGYYVPSVFHCGWDDRRALKHWFSKCRNRFNTPFGTSGTQTPLP